MAAPATLPTTLPTTVDVDGAEELPDVVPFPAAAVLVEILPVATPVPPPPTMIPPPPIDVALGDDEE